MKFENAEVSVIRSNRKYLHSVSKKQKLLQNIGPYSEEEIKKFVAKARRIILPEVKFYADKIRSLIVSICEKNGKDKSFKYR